jgi:hypothetical protein
MVRRWSLILDGPEKEPFPPEYEDRCPVCGCEPSADGWSDRELYIEADYPESEKLYRYCKACAPICEWCDREAADHPFLEWANDHECLECYEMEE